MCILDNILELLYPNTCAFCGKICKVSVCNKCKIEMKPYEQYKIIQCKNKFFNEFAYIFSYKGIVRKRIIEYKFREKAYLYKNFSKIIIENEKIYNFIKKYDIIIPVPIHKKRKIQRGYNQVELIAKEITKELATLEMVKNILIKVKNVKPQSTLKKSERMQNIKDVFKIKNGQKIRNKKILLIDDIYTTGSTVNECSKILKQLGVKNIGVLTIAKD